MTQIRGNGYGDKHDWQHHGNEEANYPEDRNTLWICNKCKVAFRHYYRITWNIFEQMKNLNIPEECN